MRMQLLFLLSVCWIAGLGCASVSAQQPSWQEIIEEDKKIWERRIGDESIINSIRTNYNRLKSNVATIEKIVKDTMYKLRNKDCIAAAYAIKQLTRELDYYPSDRHATQAAISQIKGESRQCQQ